MTLAGEQRPKESDKAFAAFSLYLNMGPERSLAAVAAKLGKSKTLMERWSHRHGWVDRVASHAAQLAVAQREATEALLRAKAAEWVKRETELREEEWATRKEAVGLALEAIERWKQNPNRCGTLEGIARLLELGSTLGHRATRTPMDRVEVSVEVDVNFRVEVEAAVRRVYGETGGSETTENGGRRTDGGTGDRLKAGLQAGGVVIDVEPVKEGADGRS